MMMRRHRSSRLYWTFLAVGFCFGGAGALFVGYRLHLHDELFVRICILLAGLLLATWYLILKSKWRIHPRRNRGVNDMDANLPSE